MLPQNIRLLGQAPSALHPVRPSAPQHLSWICARLRHRYTSPVGGTAHSDFGLRPIIPDRRPPRALLPAFRAFGGHRTPKAGRSASERKDGRRPVSTEHARRHLEIIAKFRRFPHRNAVLGRTSTAAELEFLKTLGVQSRNVMVHHRSSSRQEEDVLWQAFCMAAPARRRVFEPSSKRRKRAPAPLQRATT